MARYSPTVLPDDSPSQFMQAFLSELARGPERFRQQQLDKERAEERTYTRGRQERLDKEREEERAYTRGRQERLDPLEEALMRGQLYGQGIVPAEGEGPPLAEAIDGQRGQDLLAGRAQFGDQGMYAGGVNAPGSFNPITGTFNTPSIDPGFMRPRSGMGGPQGADPGFEMRAPERNIDPGFTRPAPGAGRVSLGGGYELDPSRTPEGRKESALARAIEDQVAAAVAAGVPEAEARAEIVAGGGLSPEHFHPGPWHPRTKAEADALAAAEQARALERIRAGAAARQRPGDEEKDDPQWTERRRGWAKKLGDPVNQLQQELLDALADGDEPDELLEMVPRSQRNEAAKYLQRAVRMRRRATKPPLGEEINK